MAKIKSLIHSLFGAPTKQITDFIASISTITKTSFQASLFLSKRSKKSQKTLLYKATSGLLITLISVQMVAPLAVYAAAASSEVSGNQASLDPVTNKIDKISTVGSAGVDESTGALTYAYPITVPSGRGNTTPSLALSYRSDLMKMSEVGYGWNLAVPKVTRISKFGQDKLYTKGTLVSSLHGELMLQASNEWVPQVVKSDLPVYTSSANGIEMRTMRGEVYTFGSSPAARTESVDGSKVAEWALTSYVDQFGNKATYSYVKRGSIAMLSSISYTEHVQYQPLFAVSFTYATRTSPTISYEYGFKTEENSLLTQVRVTSQKSDVAYIDLEYSKGSNGYRDLLTRISERRKGSDGTWNAMSPTVFTYEKGDVKWEGSSTPERNPFQSCSGCSGYWGVPAGFYGVVVDTNNDGILEKLWIESGTTYADFAGEGIVKKIDKAFILRATTGQSFPVSDIVALRDVNNDGYDDIFAQSQVFVFTKNGYELSPLYTTQYKNLPAQDQYVDTNNDGLIDRVAKLVSATGTNYVTYLNTGTEFSAVGASVYTYPINSGDYDDGVRFIDVNGDGLVDLVHMFASYDQPTACRSDSLYYPNPALPYAYQAGSTPGRGSFKTILLQSENGFTQKVDAPSGVIAEYIYCYIGWGPQYLDKQSALVYDQNGDGMPDIGGAINKSKRADLLISVQDPFGASMDIAYENSLAVTVGHTGRSHTVVSSLTPRNGSIKLEKTSYTYGDHNFYYDSKKPENRSFAGFGTVIKTRGTLETITYYHQANGTGTREYQDAFELMRMPYLTVVRDKAKNEILSQSQIGYTIASALGASMVYPSVQAECIAEQGVCKEWTVTLVSKDALTTQTFRSVTGVVTSVPFDMRALTIEQISKRVSTEYSYTAIKPYLPLEVTMRGADDKISTVQRTQYDNLPSGFAKNGLPTSVTVDGYAKNGTISQSRTVSAKYTNVGMVSSEMDAAGVSTYYTYDPYGMSPVKIVKDTSVNTNGYYYPTGSVIQSSNSLSTTTQIVDGFGRVTQIDTTAPGITIPRTTIEYITQSSQSAVITTQAQSGGNVRNISTYDAFGRVVYTKNNISKNVYLTKSYEYDLLGNLSKASLVSSEDTLSGILPAKSWTSYTYDALGRVLTMRTPDTAVSYVHSGRSVTALDGDVPSRAKQTVYNYLGKVENTGMKQSDGSFARTSYTYDEWGNLIKITDPMALVTEMSYDAFGNKVKYRSAAQAQDVTVPTVSYSYDARGLLVNKTSKRTSTAYTYNALGDITQEVTSKPSAETVSLLYTGCINNLRKPCTVTTASESVSFTYDALGRPLTEKVTYAGIPYTKAYTYNSDGNISRVANPDGTYSEYEYDYSGYQTSVAFWNGSTHKVIATSERDLTGKTASVAYTNNTRMCVTRDNTKNTNLYSGFTVLFNAASCADTTGSTPLFTSSLSRAQGLPQSKNYAWINTSGTQEQLSNSYVYDSSMRLVNWQGTYGTSTLGASLSYDTAGRITKKNGTEYMYGPGAQGGAYAPTSVGIQTYLYDEDGNTLGDGIRSLVWDAKGKVSQVKSPGGTESHVYGYDGSKRASTYTLAATSSPRVAITQSFTAQTQEQKATTTQSLWKDVPQTSKKYMSERAFTELSAFGLVNDVSIKSILSDTLFSPLPVRICGTNAQCIVDVKREMVYQVLMSLAPSRSISIGTIDEIIEFKNGYLTFPSSSSFYTGSSTIQSTTSIGSSDSIVKYIYNKGTQSQSVSSQVWQNLPIFLASNQPEWSLTIPSSTLAKDGYVQTQSVLVMYDTSRFNYGVNSSSTIRASGIIGNGIVSATSSDIGEVLVSLPHNYSSPTDANMAVRIILTPLISQNAQSMKSGTLDIRFTVSTSTVPQSAYGVFAHFERYNPYTGSSAYIVTSFTKQQVNTPGSLVTYTSSSTVASRLPQGDYAAPLVLISPESEALLGSLGLGTQSRAQEYLARFGCTAVSCPGDAKVLVREHILRFRGIALSDKAIREMVMFASGDAKLSNTTPRVTDIDLATFPVSTVCSGVSCATDLMGLPWQESLLTSFGSSTTLRARVSYAIAASGVWAGLYTRALDTVYYSNMPGVTVTSSGSSTRISNEHMVSFDVTNALILGKPVGAMKNVTPYFDMLRHTISIDGDAALQAGTSSPVTSVTISYKKVQATTSVVVSSSDFVTGATSTQAGSVVTGSAGDQKLTAYLLDYPELAYVWVEKQPVSYDIYQELVQQGVQQSTVPAIRTALRNSGIKVGDVQSSYNAIRVLLPNLTSNASKELYLVVTGRLTIPGGDNYYIDTQKVDITSLFTHATADMNIQAYAKNAMYTVRDSQVPCVSSLPWKYQMMQTGCIVSLAKDRAAQLDTTDNVRYVLEGKAQVQNQLVQIDLGTTLSPFAHPKSSTCLFSLYDSCSTYVPSYNTITQSTTTTSDGFFSVDISNEIKTMGDTRIAPTDIIFGSTGAFSITAPFAISDIRVYKVVANTKRVAEFKVEKPEIVSVKNKLMLTQIQDDYVVATGFNYLLGQYTGSATGTPGNTCNTIGRYQASLPYAYTQVGTHAVASCRAGVPGASLMTSASDTVLALVGSTTRITGISDHANRVYVDGVSAYMVDGGNTFVAPLAARSSATTTTALRYEKNGDISFANQIDISNVSVSEVRLIKNNIRISDLLPLQASSTLSTSTRALLASTANLLQSGKESSFWWLTPEGRDIVSTSKLVVSTSSATTTSTVRATSTNFTLPVSATTTIRLAALGLIDEVFWNALFKATSTDHCISMLASTTCETSARIAYGKQVVQNLTGMIMSDQSLFEVYAVYAGAAYLDDALITASGTASGVFATPTLASATSTYLASYLSLQASSTWATGTQNIAAVPAGLLTDAQFISIYGKAVGYAGGTTTKPIAESTFNEFLQTGIRDNQDVMNVFDVVRTSLGCASWVATSSTCGDALATSTFKSWVGTKYGILLSDTALEDALAVRYGYYTILPDVTGIASTTVKSESARIPLDPSRTLKSESVVTLTDRNEVTGATSTISTTTSRVGVCDGGVSCTIVLPSLPIYSTDITLTGKTGSTQSIPLIIRSIYEKLDAQATSTATNTARTYLVIATSTATATVSAGTFSLPLGTLYTQIYGMSEGRIEIAFGSSSVISPALTLVYQASYPTRTYSTTTRTLFDAYKASRLALTTSTGSATRDMSFASTTFLSGDYESTSGARSITTGAATQSTRSFVPLKTWKIPTMSTSVLDGTWDCMNAYLGGGYTYNFNYCSAGYGMYGNTSGAHEYKFNYGERDAYKANPQVTDWVLNFTVKKTAESNLSQNDTVTICALWNNQTVPDCTKDPSFISSTTAKIGDIAQLNIKYSIYNSSWTAPGLTAIRLGVDTSKNPQAGILINADSNMSIQAGYYTTVTSGTPLITTQVTGDSVLVADNINYAALSDTKLTNYVAYVPATGTATTSLFQKSIATTSTYTVITPFDSYELDSRGLTTISITLNGTPVALFTYDRSATSTTKQLQYIITDEIGTPVLYTDDSGKVARVYLTDPFGRVILSDVRNDSFLSSKSFATYSSLPGSGLLYARARMYDPVTSLFLSEDPLAPSTPSSYISDPEQLNTYSYARNNPVVFNDPSGEYVVSTGQVEKGDTLTSIVKKTNQTYGTNYTVNGFAQSFNISNPNKITTGSYYQVQAPSSYEQYTNGMSNVLYSYGTAATNMLSGNASAPQRAGHVVGGLANVALAGSGLIEKYLFTTGMQVLRGAANPKVKEAAAYGREMHRLYKLDVADEVKFIKEFPFENGMRADYVDQVSKTIYELKPNNPQAVTRGHKQLEQYQQQMFKETGEWYNIVLETYTR